MCYLAKEILTKKENMKITDNGIIFEDYKAASPSTGYCLFVDVDGAKFLIKAETIVNMYNLIKFDLERRSGWEEVMQRVEESRIKV